MWRFHDSEPRPHGVPWRLAKTTWGFSVALGVRPWMVSMASLYVYMHGFCGYVAFIANVDYLIMWIVWGMISGTH